MMHDDLFALQQKVAQKPLLESKLYNHSCPDYLSLFGIFHIVIFFLCDEYLLLLNTGNMTRIGHNDSF